MQNETQKLFKQHQEDLLTIQAGLQDAIRNIDKKLAEINPASVVVGIPTWTVSLRHDRKRIHATATAMAHSSEEAISLVKARLGDSLESLCGKKVPPEYWAGSVFTTELKTAPLVTKLDWDLDK